MGVAPKAQPGDRIGYRLAVGSAECPVASCRDVREVATGVANVAAALVTAMGRPCICGLPAAEAVRRLPVGVRTTVIGQVSFSEWPCVTSNPMMRGLWFVW